MIELKWNKFDKKQPEIGQKIIWKKLKETESLYSIYYGTYLGAEHLGNKVLYDFRMWFDGNPLVYGNISDVIWIPYPVGEDEL